MNKLHGIFTVVIGSERRTLRVITPQDGAMAGKTIIQFLSGSDNEHAYTGCAFMRDDRRGYTLWKRYQHSDLDRFIGALFNHKTCAAAGLAYALESGRCFRCNHVLTVPASIHAGLGPDCAKKTMAG